MPPKSTIGFSLLTSSEATWIVLALIVNLYLPC
jgi:hypothetical protein